jgi:hypothetical protein
MSSAECVKVVVRCRPLNSKEKEDGRQQIVNMDDKSGTCVIQPLNAEPKTFTFDAVYPPNTEQAVLYKRSAAYIVDSVLEGYNGTIFACAVTALPFHAWCSNATPCMRRASGPQGHGKLRPEDSCGAPVRVRELLPSIPPFHKTNG